MSTAPNGEEVMEVLDKVQIAKRIVSQSETYFPPHKAEKLTRYLERAICHYTGVDLSTVHEVLNHMDDLKTKTFLDWYEERSDRNQSLRECGSCRTYEQIRDIIIDQYVNQLRVPTKASLLGAITDGNKYTYVNLNQDLSSFGFVWKRLPKTNKYIIVEKNEQVSTRMKYLHRMKEYRDNERHIVHLERTLPCYYYVTQSRVLSTEIILIASPILGVFDTYYPAKKQSLEFWLRNKLNAVPENSVFVIEQSNLLGMDKERKCELPTIHSLKKHMIEWLDTYDIPYDPMAHRADLFALIEKYKVLHPTSYQCTEILKAAGHDVILRPPELTYTKYFKEVLKKAYEKKHWNLKQFRTFFDNHIATIQPEDWLEQDRIMAEKESKIFEEDLKLELILDKLMESMKEKDNGLSEFDFVECEEDALDSEHCEKIVCDSTLSKPYAATAMPGPSIILPQ